MNDEQMQPLLDTWFRDREVAPRDIRAGVATVMADVPSTRQQGRWWPLPAFDHPTPIPATDGPTPARGFSMFSALKFVAAAAIVALFGGFLLAGILTAPQSDEMVPGAVTESPSAMTTDALPSTLVTEEVEPGILRVVNDGARDFTRADIRDIVAGLDGGIWFFDSDGFFRLGDKRQGSSEMVSSTRAGS